jgi:hypothetical protein
MNYDTKQQIQQWLFFRLFFGIKAFIYYKQSTKNYFGMGRSRSGIEAFLRSFSGCKKCMWWDYCPVRERGKCPPAF